jgi:uridine monophosphate synthetase
LPMILRRKEAKDYGTKKIIEGVFRPGQTCLIIEDVVTSGSSILETIEPLSKEGLITNNIALVIDREHGGKERLELQGLQLHALMTISNLLHILYREEKIDKSTIDNVFAFLEIQHLSKK